MTINAINLFSFPIYEFLLPDEKLVEKLVDQITLLDNSQNVLNTTIRNSDKQLNYSFYNDELFSYINEGLSEIKSLHYEGDFNFVITECWGTKTNKFQKHHIHTHPNSIVSGIVYLTDHSEATTEFYLPNPWNWTDQFLKISKEQSRTKVASVSPKLGKVVFFPSNLQHSTKPNLANLPRYTISFNTFISGTIGNPTTLLKIAPTDVEYAHTRTFL